MHTRIVSLYHEVVEFGISAKDYEVSSFSMYREASRYTVLLEVCRFEMFGPQRYVHSSELGPKLLKMHTSNNTNLKSQAVYSLFAIIQSTFYRLI